MNKLGLVSFACILASLVACSNKQVASTDAGPDLGTDAGLDLDLGLDLAIVVDAGSDAGAAACPVYCAGIGTTCTGANLQYANESDCLAACSTNNKWPVGTAGATSGDSFACRQYHLEAAGSDANTHCVHAGPTGGGLCGSLCENYCQLAASNCTGTDSIYGSAEECMTACTGIPSDGEVNAASGDSVQCRIYQLGIAGSSSVNAATHCMFGAENGGGVCVTL